MGTTSTTIRVRVKDEASPGLKSIAANVGKFSSTLGTIGGSSAVAGLTAAALAVRGMVNALDDLDEAAQNAGVAAVALADLRIGAREAGVDSDLLDKALTKLNARLADARAGGADSQRIFRALGYDFKATGANAEDALKALSRGVSNWRDGTEKLAFIYETLGEKVGAKFVAYLNQGEDGLARFSGATPEAVASAAKLAQQFDQLAASWERLKNAFAGFTFPAINERVEWLSRIDWGRVTAPIRDGGFAVSLRVLQELSIEGERARLKMEQVKKALALLPEGGVPDPNLNRFAKQLAPALPKIQAPPKFEDSFLKAAEAIDQQIRALEQQSEIERVLTDIEQGRIKVVGEGERQYLLQLAAGLDARKERIEAAKEEQRTIEAAMDSAIKAQERLDEITGRAGVARQGRDAALLDDAFFSGKINQSEYDAGLRNVFSLVDGTNEKLKEQKSLVEEIGLTFTSAFEDAIGSGNGLRGVIKGLGQDLLRLATRKLITEPLGNALMGLLKGLPSLGSIFGGGRAIGGPVDSGTAYLVGERGPELFVPQSAGTIVPNGAAGGVVITQQISIDARSDLASVRAAMVLAKEEAKREVLASMQRRGAFA